MGIPDKSYSKYASCVRIEWVHFYMSARGWKWLIGYGDEFGPREIPNPLQFAEWMFNRKLYEPRLHYGWHGRVGIRWINGV